MKVEIKIEGSDELRAAFKTVESGMLDLRQLGTWDAVASEFYKIEKEQFASEGAAGKSGKWKQLSPDYAKIKLKRWGSVPILQASGETYRSLTSRGAAGSVLEKSAQELTIGTSIKKAGYHQRGNARLPQRKMIDFTDEQLKQLAKPIAGKMRQLVANARLRNVRGF